MLDHKAMKHLFAIILALLTLSSCGTKQQAPKQTKSYAFNYVNAPFCMSREQQYEYVKEHFWDNFDFADTLYTTKADTIEMCRAFAAYVQNFVDPTNQEPIRKLMQRASASKKMFDYFVMLSDRVLHDPNSPLRSDELYIAVLEAQIASPYYDKYEKMAPEYDLRLASQNRINHKANDFYYTLKSGQSRNLYALRSEFIIIYINNPGCAMCREITEALNNSAIIKKLQQQKRLKVLAIYPDEDLAEWHKHYADIPSAWINSYDKGCHIRRENLYNVNAIPALYLLDKNKIVQIKDSTNVEEIEYALNTATK